MRIFSNDGILCDSWKRKAEIWSGGGNRKGYPGEDPRMGTLVLEGDIMQEMYVGLTPSFQEQEVSLKILKIHSVCF